jgi:hypothetical protein
MKQRSMMVCGRDFLSEKRVVASDVVSTSYIVL